MLIPQRNKSHHRPVDQQKIIVVVKYIKGPHYSLQTTAAVYSKQKT